jgi:zinc transporter ZupT
MTRSADVGGGRSERAMLIALAVCCAVPMIAIIVLTSVVGIALGPAVAVALGVVAAGICVAVMVQRHQARPHHHTDEGHQHGH